MKVLIIFILASFSSFGFAEESDLTKSTQQKVLSTANGRYVFGQVSEFRRDKFLLDTQTGRLWELVVDNKEQHMLQPVKFIQLLSFGDSAIPDSPQAVVEYKEISQKIANEEQRKSKKDSGKKDE